MWMSNVTDGGVLVYVPSKSHAECARRGFLFYNDALLYGLSQIKLQQANLYALPTFVCRVIKSYEQPDVRPGISPLRLLVQRISLENTED
jgi:hypothetical protein